jgi:regulatory protein
LLKGKISKEMALKKAQHYCAWQERSHKEVKEKLYGFGLFKGEVETLLAQLIEDNYLNEERFAQQFAQGKFRMKKWGRIKIVYELKQKQVSTYNINKGIEIIDETAYENTLQGLAKTKWNSLKNDTAITKKAKTLKYLQQKGYELPLIQQAVKLITEAHK